MGRNRMFLLKFPYAYRATMHIEREREREREREIIPQLPGCVIWMDSSTASLMEFGMATRWSTHRHPDFTCRSYQKEWMYVLTSLQRASSSCMTQSRISFSTASLLVRTARKDLVKSWLRLFSKISSRDSSMSYSSGDDDAWALLGPALVVEMGVDRVRNVTLWVCGEVGGLLCDASFADILIWSICCFELAIKWQLEFCDWIRDVSVVSDLSKWFAWQLKREMNFRL